MRKVRREEMDFLAGLGDNGVWEYRTIEQCYQDTGRAPLGVRWVDTDKGYPSRPDYRSRLVVQETRARSTIAADDVGAIFAATPPLECLRILCSTVMSSDPAEGRVLRFLDISRAHPRRLFKRTVYILFPEGTPAARRRASVADSICLSTGPATRARTSS